MDLPEWYEGKSAAYVACVEKFVEEFGDDADLEEDVKPDPDNEDDDLESREIARMAVADFITALHPNDAREFDDDARTALFNLRELQREDDELQYGGFDQDGQPISRADDDD